MDVIQAVALIAAAVTTGVMAGIFQVYTYAVMPGLSRVDDRTFVGAFQAVDRAIMNPLFLSHFLGALVFTGAASLLHLGDGDRSVLPWVGTAFVLYMVVFVTTIAVNVPLNDSIKAAGDPGVIRDLRAVRTRFDEGKWARWNLMRAILTTAALGCLTWALVAYGRL